MLIALVKTPLSITAPTFTSIRKLNSYHLEIQLSSSLVTFYMDRKLYFKMTRLVHWYFKTHG